ncbi:MAG: ThuA domain-containing protein [Vicinamibacteria bacterium]
MRRRLFALVLAGCGLAPVAAAPKASFRVLAFYTHRDDPAHVSFARGARMWFAELGRERGFEFAATDDWGRLNDADLVRQDVVLFLDARPDQPAQRAAFRKYMEGGGAFMGFHFAGFALSPSKYPQDWDWYHEELLGAGAYVSNTWRPTAATLRVDGADHPVTRGLPRTIRSAPNEWYRWQRDLRKNPDIRVLLSIDSSSFPVGTGPKPHEIWHRGDYPVVWTSTRYRMVYMNMGHDDIDYEGGTNRALSSTFAERDQNALLAQALVWLGTGRPPRP